MAPPGVEELQRQAEEQGSTERIWVGDQTLPAKQQGVIVLGSPIGTKAFAEEHAKKRLEEEARLWELLPKLPDLQCAWVLLFLCSAPRANYGIRSQPPEQVELYAAAHDQGVWETLCDLLERQDVSNNLTLWQYAGLTVQQYDSIEEARQCDHSFLSIKKFWEANAGFYIKKDSMTIC